MTMTDKLTPEQERTLRVFNNNYPNLKHSEIFHVGDVNLDQITITNSKIFVEGKISRKTLPHETHWLWNQSKSKVVVTLNHHESVVITKFNPRRLPKSMLAHPSFKLWACEINSPRVHSQISLVWCEKGKETPWSPAPLVRSPVSPPQPISSPSINQEDPDMVLLSDLSFLRDFIDPNVAVQFGWIKHQSW